jgi:medium-chain acyl-[acyl-carrier-protein] hydrolase
VFADFGDVLGPGVEVAAARLPGRESRLAEPPIAEVRSLVDRIIAALAPSLDARPFALLGCSVGALVAFELARGLRREGLPMPTVLIAAACPAPRRQALAPDLHALGDAELRSTLERLGGTPPEVLASDELLELVLPALQADFALAGTYEYRAEPPLPCRITTIRGDRDPYTSAHDDELWGAETERGAAAHRLPGGHFLVREQRASLLELVASALSGGRP